MTGKSQRQDWNPMREAARIAVQKLHSDTPGTSYKGGKYSHGEAGAKAAGKGGQTKK
jgi:hypothetical protein